MEKRQIILAIVLLLSATTYFLPWFTVQVSFNGEVWTETSYGYYYVVPFVAPYTVSVGVLCVMGFILSAISFKLRQRFELLNIAAGIFILIGVAGSFIYTFSVAFSGVSPGKTSWSVNVWGEYGTGLMFLSGLLIAAIGAIQKLYGALKELYMEMKPLVKIGVCGIGIVVLILGMIFIAMSVYSLVGGNVQFVVQETVLPPEEGAKIFLTVGTIVLILGALVTFAGFKKIK